MTGIHKTIKKVTPKEIISPMGKKLDKAVGEGWDSLNPKLPASAAEEAVMPLADEEEIRRNKRRTASARGGGRASTIFTDSDRLGP